MKKAVFLAALVLVLRSPAGALALCPQSRGQTVYVPATYNDFTNLVNQEEKSATRLVIFNIDRQRSLTLTSVKFYSPLGVLVKEYLATPLVIAPLSSVSFRVTDFSSLGVGPYDPNGGRPCFLVKWRASGMICAPLLESRWVILRNTAGVWGMEAMDFVGGIVLEESPPPLPFLYFLLQSDVH